MISVRCFSPYRFYRHPSVYRCCAAAASPPLCSRPRPTEIPKARAICVRGSAPDGSLVSHVEIPSPHLTSPNKQFWMHTEAPQTAGATARGSLFRLIFSADEGHSAERLPYFLPVVGLEPFVSRDIRDIHSRGFHSYNTSWGNIFFSLACPIFK